MRRVKVSTVISASCEEVFDVVADLSRRPAFTDHYLKDFRLARSNPCGTGASARFLLDRPVFSERAEVWIAECDRPSRIVEEGRVGRRGRSTLSAVYEFHGESEGRCRVEMTTESKPKTAVDRLRQRGAHRWVQRNTKKALSRLRRLLEEPGEDTPERVTVAGYEPHTAPRFGDHVRLPGRTAPADG
jgi:ribosome-associated toxin RatA of RatAB toxin-antitoxin module